MEILQKLIALACIFGAVWFMLPLISNILHIGMVYPALLLTLIASMLLFSEKIKTVLSESFWNVAFAILVAGALIIAVFIGFMALSASNRPKNQEKITVVVLGCKVDGNVPSRMLYDRIKTAYDYLSENPQAVCVASGGQGNGESISEAECIKRELVKLGIDETRIFIEDKSTNTRENIMFSVKVIAENSLPTDIAIASDNFHQLRAKIYADKNGLNAYSLGCPTVWYLSPSYWTREIPAIIIAIFR